MKYYGNIKEEKILEYREKFHVIKKLNMESLSFYTFFKYS